MKLKALKYIMPLVATVLMGCGPSGSSFVINGSFEDMEGAELYMYNLSDNNASFDTITVAGGEFHYEGECDQPTPYILVFSNAVEQVIFVSPGKKVTYTASSGDLRNYQVKGTDENVLMNDFREQTRESDAKQILEKASQFINQHSQSAVAVYLFDRYYIQNRSVGYGDIRKILNVLKVAQPKNSYLLNIEGKLKSLEKSTVGKNVPNVSLVRGDIKRQLWDKKEKPKNTCILFWSSWSNGSYDFLWRMRDIAQRDSINGRFVGISLDTEYFRFQNDIRTDSVNGIEQYCDAMSLESPVVKEIGVPTVPYYIISDKKHKIVATGSDVEQMAKDILKWMK